ncbi:MAG: AAA domain-containing protein [Nitrososphaeraceae archaeon]
MTNLHEYCFKFKPTLAKITSHNKHLHIMLLSNKEKYLQIFNYLYEFSKLRSKPVRDIISSKNYLDIIWFSNIPVNEKIDCVIHDNYTNEGEHWLKVSKPKEPVKPIFPKPPITLEKWIIPESLLNKDELPDLLQEIEIEEQILRIEEYPEIKAEFEEYCETKWFNDSDNYWRENEIYVEKYRKYDQVNSVYKRLFSIYNKSQQFGEEYELVIGVGLMHFKEGDETPLICRHIISAKTEIQFEFSKRDSSIIVSQGIENGLVIETDAIIDLFDQFDSNDIIEAEKRAKELIKEKELVNPFDKDIHEVLQLLSERIKPGDGKYVEEISKSKDVATKETIFYAPSLILRKRDTRSYTSMYEKIIEDIKDTTEPYIPTLDDIVLEASGSDTNKTFTEIEKRELNLNDTIYFPNKFNDEQISIIEKSRRNNKVLVQGPPGTGKSHTISNLICHLLANGKKVLVTAQKPRALEVLKDKLPDEFKSLTVNLLSGDSTSIKDLEASVNTINDELSNTDISNLKKEIKDLENELTKLKKNRAFDTNQLLKIKEKSTRNISINPKYNGTLTEIGASIDSDKSNFDWYKDDYDKYDNVEILEKLRSYIPKYKYYLNVDISIFDTQLPKVQDFFEEEAFKDFVDVQNRVVENNLSKDNCNIIIANDFPKVIEILNVLLATFKKIEKIYLPQKEEIISDSLRSNKHPWFEKIEKSIVVLSEFKKTNLRYKDRNLEIEFPKNKSLISLKNDAKVLLEHLKAGNTLSGVGFKIKKAFFSKEIKEKLYFVESVLVNGSPCDTEQEFENVLEDIRIKQNFIELEEIWQINEDQSKYEQKFNQFETLVSQVQQLINDIDSSFDKIQQLKLNSNVSISDFNSGTVISYLNDIANTIDLQKLDKYLQQRSDLSNNLIQPHIHPIGKEIIDALSELDFSKYKFLIAQLENLQKDFEDYRLYRDLKNELNICLPSIIEAISESGFSETQIPELKQAILFKHATNEVTRLLSKDTEFELKEKLKSYDSIEERLIAKLSSKKSWVYVLENLNANRNLRQHLEAWVQAVKKIGKTGRGKSALKFRKIAQKQMEYCKTSVPCWIMPLYKVTETIQPEKEIYDYVIVDEASQLGPDAIFLLYISKNIIIVGDDKQTSPEYIGVDGNAMTPYINRHLGGIPFKNFYGTEYSFFDHATRFCEGRIVLREHFRCMPEIIEFSNKLFYASDGKGLFPLKQYSENRLEPLMHYYCQNGFVEGQSSNIRNVQEAQAISDKIYEIINNERYKGKSIGVICLQGNAQSALVETLLIKQIGEKEFKSRKIICGNSASFQGDERDIIFLSLVTATNHNRSALTRPEDERRFNVAVSRAIEQIWLFHSILPEDLSNSNDLRFKLLDHFLNYNPSTPPISKPIERTLGSQPAPFDSWFEVDVFNDIVNKGYSVKPQYEVAKGKYRIDLVAFFPDGTKIAIECDGDRWHGADRFQDDMLRQKVLERCGWQFFRVRGGEYYSNKEKALEPLWEIFKKHTINVIVEENDKCILAETQSNCESNIVQSKVIKEREDINLNNNQENNLDVEIDNDTSYRKENGLKNKVRCNQDFSDDSLNGKESDTTFTIEECNSDKILRYFNLYKSGNYILSEKEKNDADYTLPIKSSHANGYLLQCYKSGHINKVYITTLLSKRIDKEYMNGVNLEDSLSKLLIIEKDEIIGIYIKENGVQKFKAHLTENISCREQLHLKGYKVVYKNFSEIKYQLISIRAKRDLKRLIFQSFSATGKPVNNSYYASEWNAIQEYSRKPMIDNCSKTNDIDLLSIEDFKKLSRDEQLKALYEPK